MRRALFLLLLVAPGVLAGEREQRLERAAIARTAFDARMRLGDLARDAGNRAEALRLYAEAVTFFLAELPDLENEVVVNEVIGIGGGAGGGFRARRGGAGGRGGGGAVRAENPVDRGLAWLAAHQDVKADGRWDADDFMKHDPADDKTDGKGAPLFDVGVTGLALLAFLGSAYTDRGDAATNPYRENVRMGLRFLLTSQDAQGCFGPRTAQQWMYNHAIATLAVCEAYALTSNPRYKKPAADGIAFLLAAQNPGGGWRYGIQPGESDTSVTAWCVAALKSGKGAGLEVPDRAFADALAWVDRMTDKDFGRGGYIRPGGAPFRPDALAKAFPEGRTEAMTAAGILTRILCGQDPRRTDAIEKGADLCVAKPPVWNPDSGTIDMYYWYFGTMALFQVGGGPWRKWNAAMKKAIVAQQHARGSGARSGSWDPIGVWARDSGGRVYSTALMALSLEVYYRYDRVIGGK